MNLSPYRSYISEFIGTFILVFLGCGSAIFTGAYIGILGVALTFGLTLIGLVNAIGPVSGCHLNPAVTLCLSFRGILPKNDVPFYIIAQLIGAACAGYALYWIALGQPDFHLAKGFAETGFGAHSPHLFSLKSCLVAETLATTIFLFVILSSSIHRSTNVISGIYIGLTLSAVILFCAPITNASINFARSFGVALIVEKHALSQLWLFGASNMIAAVLANILFCLTQKKDESSCC
ncbi:MAG: Aquaporin Z 2 [Holosporales bacterium]